MTDRKRGSSGRTTPKGTKSPQKKAHRNRGAGTAESAGGLAERKQDAHTTQWVSRPITHSRGNR